MVPRLLENAPEEATPLHASLSPEAVINSPAGSLIFQALLALDEVITLATLKMLLEVDGVAVPNAVQDPRERTQATPGFATKRQPVGIAHQSIHHVMAKQEATYLCDVCGSSYATGADVRGSVSVYSSHGSFICGDVCDECADRVLKTLVRAFPGIAFSEHSHDTKAMESKKSI